MKNEQENINDDLKDTYQQYHELGGIINEKDYRSALGRALDHAQKMTTVDNKSLIAQVEFMADKSGIRLNSRDGVLDPRVSLYGILRTDTNPGVKYHHSQMGDQQIFAEALRMLGDADSLKKLIEAYSNIFHENEKKVIN